MPPQNPFSSFANPNSFFGQPLIPRIGRTLSRFGRSAIRAFTPQEGTPPPTMAGVSIPPQGASATNLNPVPFLQGLNPFGSSPLVRTDYGERPQPQAPVVPQFPSGSDYQANVARQPSIPVPLPEPTMASFATPLTPSLTTPQVPTAPQPMAPSFEQPKTPIQTAYGTIYATPSQEAAAQRLAQRRPMEGRLANIGEQIVNPRNVMRGFREIDAINEANISPKEKAKYASRSMEGLNQAERIAVMRQRGRQLGQQRVAAMEQGFAEAREQRRKEFEQKETQRAIREAARNPANTARNTTQRSWSNYDGPNPIKNKVGTDFYKDSELYG